MDFTLSLGSMCVQESATGDFSSYLSMVCLQINSLLLINFKKIYVGKKLTSNWFSLSGAIRIFLFQLQFWIFLQTNFQPLHSMSFSFKTMSSNLLNIAVKIIIHWRSHVKMQLNREPRSQAMLGMQIQTQSQFLIFLICNFFILHALALEPFNRLSH